MPLFRGRKTVPEYAALRIKPKKLFHSRMHTMIRIYAGTDIAQKTKGMTTRAEYGFYHEGWWYRGTDGQWHVFP